MPSSLFGQRNPQPQQPRNNGNIIRQFAEFKRQMAGKDPKAILQQLLSEGKMTPQQFDQLKAEAQGLMSILR